MTKTKNLWRRRLSLLFCAILIFCGAFPVAAYADSATVTSGSMYSYFQTFGSNGTWKDIQTPSHWITQTGEVAYCLQTEKDTPYNSGYSSVDGSAYYNQRVLTGLQAILENGYPVTNGGYTDEQARYATANAVRFWMAENYCDGMPQYLNLNVNGDWIRGKYGYEGLYNWALSLVQLARNQAVSAPSSGSISFSANPLALTEDASGDYFVGSVSVSKTITGNYGLSNNLPDGSAISGYTGGNGDQLTIQIPTAYQEQSYTLTAYGSHSANTAKCFFWQPDAWNQQRVVTCVIGWDSSYVETSMTVTTPTATPKNGSIRLTKTGEDGNPLPGVTFALYDASQTPISSGTTDSSGIITFADLPLGSYYYAETATLPGYILDSTLYPVSITEGGQLVTVTATNTLARGNVSVLKVDENSTPLAGVHFVLKNSSGSVVGEGDTDGNGALSFAGLLLGDYTVQETATLPGYVLDTTVYPATVSENGQIVTVSATNIFARGNVSVLKTDETGTLLASVHFVLKDSAGNVAGEGDTDGSGALIFTGLLLGDYTVQETATLPAYVLDTTVYPVSVTENGQTVTVTATNIFARGDVSILKTDVETGEALPGVHFVLKDSDGSVIAEGDTGEDGKLSFTGLLLGSYVLQEIATVEGYVLDSEEIPVTVSENGQIVEITRQNTPIRGNLEIIKKDAYEETYLMGAGFHLYDSDGNQIEEAYTDAYGKLTFHDLLYGSYTYQEFKAPKGFELDDTVYPFSITEHGVTITHTRDNLRRPGTIQVKKQNPDGSPLAGAAFLLEYSTDDGSHWSPVVARDAEEPNLTRGGCTSPGLERGQLTTDGTGTVTFTGLRADSLILYRLTETKAPPGMSLIGGSMYVGTLPVESENIYANDAEVFDSKAFVYTLYVTATDDPMFRLPETGGSGFTYLPFAMLLLAAPIFIFKKNRKESFE